MASISRADFKYNFLKTIIIRLDFQGVFEPELEKVLPQIKPYLKEKGFNRYEKKTANQIEINVGKGVPPMPASGRIQSQEMHSFINEDFGFVLDVSSSVICLSINSTGYIPFESYSVLISNIANIYKKNIDFFTVTRLGIRKTNICMVNEKSRIKDLFSPGYFGYFESIKSANTIASNRRDTFSVDKCKVNLFCNIDQGVADKTQLYKLTLDIDAYLDDPTTIEQVVCNTNELNKMNELLFSVYINSLTEDFKKALMTENDPILADIIGIEKNE